MRLIDTDNNLALWRRWLNKHGNLCSKINGTQPLILRVAASHGCAGPPQNGDLFNVFLAMMMLSIFDCTLVRMDSSAYGRTNYFSKLAILQVGRRRVILHRCRAAQTANNRLPDPAGIHPGRDHHEAD